MSSRSLERRGIACTGAVQGIDRLSTAMLVALVVALPNRQDGRSWIRRRHTCISGR